jgi:hypothetical protein
MRHQKGLSPRSAVGHGLPLNYITVMLDLSKLSHVDSRNFGVKLHGHLKRVKPMAVPALVAAARHVKLGLTAVFDCCPLFADGAEHLFILICSLI